MRFSSVRLTVTFLMVVGMWAIPARAASPHALQADRQPDPTVVAANVRDIRNGLREIDARLQQSLRRDVPGSDPGTIKPELESISKTLKTLDQRLSRVLALDALKPPAAGDRSQARRDFRPVTTEMEVIAKELDGCVGRVNKIDALVIKQSPRAAQPLISDLDFIRKSAERSRDATKKVLFGAAGATGGLQAKER